MGNIGSYSGQISGNRESGLSTELMMSVKRKYSASKLMACSNTRTQPQVKVLPDHEFGRRLRNTNNGNILHSGGTLTGRHQTPLRNVQSKPFSPTQWDSFDKTGFESSQNVSCRKTCDLQLKLCRSEPDLRFAAMAGEEKEEKNKKKKYKAPPPPTNADVREKQSTNWDKHLFNNCPSKQRTRLFKTRFQSKKQSSLAANTLVPSAEKNNNSDIVEEEIQASKNIGVLRPKSLLEFNFYDSSEFKKELIEATDRLRTTRVNANKLDGPFETIIHLTEAGELMPNNDLEIESRHCPRGEPSGKESSTSGTSPLLGASDDIHTPRRFYFGMERKVSVASSSYPVEDNDENLTIALRLRPVLPKKPPQIPRFSPVAAWKLLDARSQDSGISGDARPSLSFSWTPQQDLEDDSSIDEAIQEEPESGTRQCQRQNPHIFSLSLPRDHCPAILSMTFNNKGGDSSLSRLKKSVSGVLNTLAVKKEQEKVASSREDDSNWFFTRSAPNSINEHSLEVSEAYIQRFSSTARLMYLPETNPTTSPVEDKCNLPIFAKSCEELCVPESLRDPKTGLDIPWYKEKRQKKTKKFSFQSTVRQIERKRIADKLSKEADKKEKQRLGELEAMRRVEEEFQKKRAKEKANIRQQLRLYALNDNQWTSLPSNVNLKAEERQDPDGALSSSNSSLSTPKMHEELRKNKSFEDNNNTTAQATKELSEYRQIQRDYKDYRRYTKYVVDNKHFKQNTVHPEVIYNVPNVKGINFERGNYRKEFASGMKSNKSTDSNQSEDCQQNNIRKMYPNKKYSTPVTRF